MKENNNPELFKKLSKNKDTENPRILLTDKGVWRDEVVLEYRKMGNSNNR